MSNMNIIVVETNTGTTIELPVIHNETYIVSSILNSSNAVKCFYVKNNSDKNYCGLNNFEKHQLVISL